MGKRTTVTLNRIFFQEEIDMNSIKNILSSHSYKEEKGVGFTNVQIFENVLEATLIKRIPTALQEFDPQSGNFIQRDIFIFDEISFSIDFENNLVYSFTSMSKLNKVKSELKNIIKSRIVYDNVILNPQEIFDNLLEKGYDCNISEIVIKNFTYKKGAQGKFTAKIFDAQIGKILLEDYLNEIQKITLQIISANFNDFVLTISTNNSFIIKCDADDFFNILDNLKTQIK